MLVAAVCGALGASCSNLPVQQPSPAHIRGDALPERTGEIPKPVRQAAALPRPRAAIKADTYSVVVNNVPVQDLLFALARDAKLNVDIHPGITGTVSLNAIDQTLPQLLARIARQTDMRYELDGPNLAVMPDTPFLRTYRVDYVNMARDMSGTVAVNTQISSAGGGSPGAAGGANSSTTEVKNLARNRFWESLEKNLKDLLRETDKILPEGSSETTVERSDVQSTTGTGAAPAAATRGAPRPPPPTIATSPNPATLQSGATTVVRRTTFREAASVIVNPETGIVTVRATSRQHEKVQEFLDRVLDAARRQVLIEATIAEVQLSQNYQQGIDWQYLRDRGSQVAVGQGGSTQSIAAGGAFQTVTSALGSGVANTVFTLAFRNGGFTAAIRLLESFGTVKVLSSPKLSVLNNQTAVLKVTNSVVYFTVKADTTTTQGAQTTAFTTTPQSVSVGLVLSVTPQISEHDAVLLNVRPSISRITGFRQDPNPNLKATAGGTLLDLKNEVPEIETREMESIMRVSDGEIAVLGGLMQDEIDYRKDAVPGLSELPAVGNLFRHRNDTNTKTELVVFLRPVIVRDASMRGDFRSLSGSLPDAAFFRDPKAAPARKAE
ncbi:MAG: hypothetical protein Fur0039_10330 [Rhodocyclaceae bacterium]